MMEARACAARFSLSDFRSAEEDSGLNSQANLNMWACCSIKPSGAQVKRHQMPMAGARAELHLHLLEKDLWCWHFDAASSHLKKFAGLPDLARGANYRRPDTFTGSLFRGLELAVALHPE